MVVIGTDGLCKNNQAKGGQKGTWAFAVFMGGVYKGNKKGHSASTTNNEMELTAILEALKWAYKHKITATIKTDSKYATQCIYSWSPAWKRNGWRNSKGEPVANQELIQQILNHLGTCRVEWVKGHAGIKENEAADTLCNEEYINTFC